MIKILFFITAFLIIPQLLKSQTLHWERIANLGDSLHGINCLLSNDDTIFAGIMDPHNGNKGIFRSMDNGSTWTSLILGQIRQSNVKSLLKMRSIIFAAVSASDSPGVYRSFDNGNNWQGPSYLKSKDGYRDYSPVNALAANENTIFAGTGESGGNGYIYRTTDFGETWQNLFEVLQYTFVSAMAAKGDIVLTAGVYDQGSSNNYRSTDNGSSWMVADSGLTYGIYNSRYAINNYGVTGTIFFAGGGVSQGLPGIYCSSDDGISWRESDSGLSKRMGPGGPSDSIRAGVNAFAVTGKFIFASTGDAVYLSSDDGNIWHNESKGLDNVHITCLATNGKMILAGASDSLIYGADISQLNYITPNKSTDESISTYPNPLSSKTEIKFSNDERSFAQVSIINLLGAEVARLFSGTLEAGEHSFIWDASRMPAGMYECVVRMSGEVQGMPIVVLR